MGDARAILVRKSPTKWFHAPEFGRVYLWTTQKILTSDSINMIIYALNLPLILHKCAAVEAVALSSDHAHRLRRESVLPKVFVESFARFLICTGLHQ